MKIEIYRKPHEWSQAKGLCVVVDVLRAFTTAAYAFNSGATSITFVRTAEEAFELHEENPSLILMGEMEGLPIDGFHYGNSPVQIEQLDFAGKQLVQRTTAGTQGVVNCMRADRILISSFVIAEATLERIKEIKPDDVSFIITGQKNGDEDLALAEYLRERLRGKTPELSCFLKRVLLSPEGQIFQDPNYPQFSQKDLELSLEVSRFSFAIEVHNTKGKCIGKKVLMACRSRFEHEIVDKDVFFEKD